MKRDMRCFTLLPTVFLITALLVPLTGSAEPQPDAENPSLGPRELAVIVNDADPLSRRIGEYYRVSRKIPIENVIHIAFPPRRDQIPPWEFERLKRMVDAQTPRHVQAFVLTWTSPYRVGCMSITTAFAAGFDPAFCAQGCARTLISPYFNSTSRRPHDDHGWRPAMMLAAGSLGETKELIDRGVAADGTYPIGTAYLLNTTDRARNVRSLLYPATLRLLDWRLEMEVIKEDYIKGKDDVLFYFTGLKRVPHLNSNRFLPGAIADHLTSSGGKLTGSRQMNSIEWLHAGATGSYGAVVEPCAFPQKFPIPAIVIDRYLRGETLIEAYWKSVAWPGQGVFIGEPLAKPFKIGK